MADDGSTGEPLLIPLKEMASALVGSRRAFLAAGVTASTVLGQLPTQALAQRRAAKVLPRAHHAAVLNLAVSPSGGYLVSVGKPDFKIWSVAEKQLLDTVSHATTSYRSVTCSEGSAQLIVGDVGGAIEVRDQKSGWAVNATAALGTTALDLAVTGVPGRGRRSDFRG